MPESIFDNYDMPPIAKLLGWTLLEISPQAGTIAVQFDGKTDFLNPRGTIQGGILAAMLDDTLGPALFAHTEGRFLGNTIELHTHFLRPVLPGRITTEGSVLRKGRSVAFLSGKLFDSKGNLAAVATGSAALIDPGN